MQAWPGEGSQSLKKPPSPPWDSLPPRAVSSVAKVFNWEPSLRLVCKSWANGFTLDAPCSKAATVLSSCGSPVAQLPLWCAKCLTQVTLLLPLGLLPALPGSLCMPPIILGPADVRELAAAFLRVQFGLLQAQSAAAQHRLASDLPRCTLQLIATGTVLREQQIANALKASSDFYARDWQVELRLVADPAELTRLSKGLRPPARVATSNNRSTRPCCVPLPLHHKAAGFMVLDGSLAGRLRQCTRVAGLQLPQAACIDSERTLDTTAVTQVGRAACGATRWVRDLHTAIPSGNSTSQQHTDATKIPPPVSSLGDVTAHVVHVSSSTAMSTHGKSVPSCGHVVRFRHLTHLELVDVAAEWTSTWSHLLTPDVLPNLTHLKIITHDSRPVQLPFPICLPHLKQVSISGAGVCVQGSLLSVNDILSQPGTAIKV